MTDQPTDIPISDRVLQALSLLESHGVGALSDSAVDDLRTAISALRRIEAECDLTDESQDDPAIECDGAWQNDAHRAADQDHKPTPDGDEDNCTSCGHAYPGFGRARLSRFR